MGQAQFAEPLGGGLAQTSTINAPAVGATILSGAAQPYAAVPLYKGTSTTPFGTALANALGVWTFTLGTAAALNDIYRTIGGGVTVSASGGTPTPNPGATGGALDFSDPANSGHIPGI